MSIRVGTLIVLLAATVAALGPGSAVAHKKTFNSQIEVVGDDDLGGTFVFIGKMLSPREPCRSQRRMQLILDYQDGRSRVVDVGNSSRNGYFSLAGPLSHPSGGDATAGRVVALKKRFGPVTKRHRHVCKRVAFGIT